MVTTVTTPDEMRQSGHALSTIAFATTFSTLLLRLSFLLYQLPCDALLVLPSILTIDIIPTTTCYSPGTRKSLLKVVVVAEVLDSPQNELSVNSVGLLPPTLLSPVPPASHHSRS